MTECKREFVSAPMKYSYSEAADLETRCAIGCERNEKFARMTTVIAGPPECSTERITEN